jgi:hypothetical protein
MPVDAKMADGRLMSWDDHVLLDLELVTIAGPVSMRAVACVVLAGKGDEVLLGCDALKTLGIDVQDQLAQLAGSSLFDAEEDEFPVGDELSGSGDLPEDSSMTSLFAPYRHRACPVAQD